MDNEREIYLARQEAERGRQAEELLKHPLLAEAFEALNVEIVEKWKNAKDPDDRERLWLILHLLGKTKSWLEIVVQGGQKATADLEYYRKKGLLEKMRGLVA